MIVLAMLNARYIHASLGLRYLHANMGELEAQTEIVEFIITQRPLDIAEQLLARSPRIIGFGVYIWNVAETTQVIAAIKQVRPDVVIVVGGPEVSYEYDAQAIVTLADYVITGTADLAFAGLCRTLLNGGELAAGKIIAAAQVPLAQLRLPYTHYRDVDVQQRLIYVEASRGCPYKCEFCLSSLDKTAWPFDLDRFLDAMEQLHARGARHFKFVDRTFNLNIKSSVRIMEFFLARMDDRLFLHFEMVPDHLPDRLKKTIARFPSGSLQFEVGIQTFNPDVQALISRRQDNDKACENLIWLRRHTNAHIHADLIAGLPGEDLDSFAAGFDRLVALNPHEIQVGILKRLRGSPIIRHTDAYGLRFNPYPPYNVLASHAIGFVDMQRLNRFARYWDLIANSGRFRDSVKLLLGDAPFERFMRFSDWLYAGTGQTHQIALERLIEYVYRGLTDLFLIDPDKTRVTLAHDLIESGTRTVPAFLQETMRHLNCTRSECAAPIGATRQTRHMRTGSVGSRR